MSSGEIKLSLDVTYAVCRDPKLLLHMVSFLGRAIFCLLVDCTVMTVPHVSDKV